MHQRYKPQKSFYSMVLACPTPMVTGTTHLVLLRLHMLRIIPNIRNTHKVPSVRPVPPYHLIL